MTVLDLLNSTADTNEELLVLCDSQYVINPLTARLSDWKCRGWKKSDGKPVLDADLTKQLDRTLQDRRVRLEWVKGHAGYPLSETADERVRAAATAHRDDTPVARGPGFPGAGKKPALPEPLCGDTSEQPVLFELLGERA